MHPGYWAERLKRWGATENKREAFVNDVRNTLLLGGERPKLFPRNHAATAMGTAGARQRSKSFSRDFFLGKFREIRSFRILSFKNETVLTKAPRPNAFILGVSADIGAAIGARLIRDGWDVVGTGRSEERLGSLRNDKAFSFLPCDLSCRESIAHMLRIYAGRHMPWSLFVSTAGTMEPIGPFFEQDFDAWEQSVISSTARRSCVSCMAFGLTGGRM